MIRQIKTLWKLVSGEIKDVFDAISINITTKQVTTGKHVINDSVEQGAAGEEFDTLQYLGDSSADHTQAVLKGIVPTTKDYMEVWGGEDSSGQFGKGFWLYHDKTTPAMKWFYSTSGKYDGTETLLWTLESDGDVTFAKDLSITGNLSAVDISATGDLSCSGDVKLSSTSAIYFGDPSTDGTYKIVRDGDDLVTYRREATVYVEKQRIID